MDEKEQLAEELPEEEQRPPVDPNNKLYTVISLLIFAVIYGGWHLLKDNIYFSCAYYDDAFSEEDRAAVLRELGAEDMPEGVSLRYVRLHRNFDSDTLYVCFDLPEDMREDEDFPEEIFPYTYGDPLYDERVTVYPDADLVPDFVYGDVYGAMENPYLSLVVYDDGDGSTALYRYRSYKGNVRGAMDGCEKIPVK